LLYKQQQEDLLRRRLFQKLSTITFPTKGFKKISNKQQHTPVAQGFKKINYSSILMHRVLTS